MKSEKTTNKLRLSCAELRKVSETLRVNKLVAIQSVYGQQYQGRVGKKNILLEIFAKMGGNVPPSSK